jgi:hypothetical protein
LKSDGSTPGIEAMIGTMPCALSLATPEASTARVKFAVAFPLDSATVVPTSPAKAM